jgi:hypothetical protein
MHTQTSMPLSGIRTHDPSIRATEDSSCLRPRNHCGRHNVMQSAEFQRTTRCEHLKSYVLLHYEFHITSSTYLRITLHLRQLTDPIIRLVFHALVRLGRLLKLITAALSRQNMTSHFCCLATILLLQIPLIKALHTFMSPLPSNSILLDESEFESR